MLSEEHNWVQFNYHWREDNLFFWPRWCNWVLCHIFKTYLCTSCCCHRVIPTPSRWGIWAGWRLPLVWLMVNRGTLQRRSAVVTANSLCDPLKLFFCPLVFWVIAVSATTTCIPLSEIKIQLFFLPFLNWKEWIFGIHGTPAQTGHLIFVTRDMH